MTFDLNGNLATITDATQTTNLTWDARDRLIGLEQPGTVASFAYAFGRRLAKTVNGTATQFLYDGLDIAQQLEAQHTTSYLRSLAIDETLGLSNPDGTFFLTADALGSTVAVRDSSGSAVTEYTYDTFGAVSTTNPAFPNPFQFTGRENDGLAGLYYYRARYYDTSLHRFVSEDPLLAPLQNSAFAAASGPCRLSHDSVWILPLLIRSRSRDLVQLLNAYAYVGDSPVNRRDPTGLRADPACLGKCRLSYAILCSLACDVFIEIPPVFIACNAACFAASELECDKICEKK